MSICVILRRCNVHHSSLYGIKVWKHTGDKHDVRSALLIGYIAHRDRAIDALMHHLLLPGHHVLGALPHTTRAGSLRLLNHSDSIRS